MVKKKPFDHLAILPYLAAETICEQPYTGMEWSDKLRSQSEVDKIEALRQKMTPAQVNEFAEACDQHCKDAYEADAIWMLKIARAKDNRGRDQLYVWLSHWLSAYLSNRRLFMRRRQVVSDAGSNQRRHIELTPKLGELE